MNDPPPSFLSSVISPIAELVLRIGGYATLSVVFVVEMLYLAPAREAQHKLDQEQLRSSYEKIVTGVDTRDAASYATLQTQCDEMMATARNLSADNNKLLHENRDLLLELLNRHTLKRPT